MQHNRKVSRPGGQVKELLPSQQVEVVRLIEAHGLPYRDFAWQQRPSGRLPDLVVPVIIHRPSGYYCAFDQGPESPLLPGAIRDWVQYSPGEDDVHASRIADGWERQRRLVSVWLAGLRRELHAIDEWNALTQAVDRAVLTVPTFAPNRAFTDAEKTQLVARLEALERRLLTSPGVTDQQTELVQAELSELRAAVDRLGQRDWWKSALWVFNALKFVLEVVLPEEATASLQELFQEGLRILFSGRSGVPPLPPGAAT